MSRIEKTITRLLSKPKDFTWRELQNVMSHFGYVEKKANGSGRKFISRSSPYPLILHEPHPGKILKPYAVSDVIVFLKHKGHL